jgi:hypothetical protein
MSIEIAMQRFDPATNQVELRGDFDGWGAGEVLSDDDNDSLYTVTLLGQPQDATIFYKFFHTGNNTWESDPNREINTGTSPTLVIDPYYFDDRTPYTGIPTNVTFNVDMSLPAQTGFDPTTDNVYVAGNFTGTTWSDGAVKMEDPNNDTTYTVALDTLVSGELLIYKFIWSTSDAASGTWEDNPEGGDDIIPESGGNRIFGPVDGTNVIDRFWNNQDPNVQLADGNILFEIDMSVMSEVGIYDNVNDTLKLMGSFNGWNTGDPEAIMNQDPIDPDLYFLQESFVQAVLGETQLYKFLVNKADTNDLWIDAWERPLEWGGNNRRVNFMGEPNQEAGFAYYDQVSPEYVIESGVNLEMVFSVDMRPAMDPVLQALPFDPAADSLYWISEGNAFTRTQNWVDTDEMRVLRLTDADGDSIFTGTLAVQPPSFNAFQYRYAFVDVSEGDNIWTIEPAGLGADFVHRVRYIGQDAPRSFPFSSWNAPTDTWTNANTKTDQEIDPYETLVGVDDESDLYLNQYALEQNYPNPFNPATIIRFGIPQAQFVTLYVYNILGERVATLVNREMTAGVHHINFNASNLPSGVYIYSISAGDFLSTKKMILLK